MGVAGPGDRAVALSPGKRTLLLLMAVWAAVLLAHRAMTSGVRDGARGGRVYRGVVVGGTDERPVVRLNAGARSRLADDDAPRVGSADEGAGESDSTLTAATLSGAIDVEASHSPVAGASGRLAVGRRVFVELADDRAGTGPRPNHSGGAGGIDDGAATGHEAPDGVAADGTAQTDRSDPALPYDRASIAGLARDAGLLIVAGIFISLFVLVGGRDWLGSVAGLGLSIGATAFVLPPMILHGIPPQAAVLLIGGALCIAISLLVSGITRRTAAICVGCLAGLLLTALLSGIVSHALKLTGVHSPATTDLWASRTFSPAVLVQLMSAGITLGAVGVVIDLATAVASAVFEVASVLSPHPATPSPHHPISSSSLIRSGLQVGRDVMGTELNTLAFAYAGVHVGLLLLPFYGPRGYELPLIQVLSLQEFAVEAAHVLVGTAGLILTIPLTAIAAGFLAARPGPGVWGVERGTNRDQAATSLFSSGCRPQGLCPKPQAPSPKPSSFIIHLSSFIIFFTLLSALGLWHYSRSHHTYAATSARRSAELVRAEAVAASPSVDELGDHAREQQQDVAARVLTGPSVRAELAIHNPISGFPAHDKPARPGDRFLVKTISSGGMTVASILDYDRGPALIVLLWGVGILAMAVGGLNGVRAIAALAVSALILAGAVYLIAARGYPALATFAAAALPACAASFVIIAGPSRKALAAGAGAFAGSAIGGTIASIAGAAMAFTGLQSDSLFAIRMMGGRIDFAGLFAGGILLGILGVAMDVAMAVASSAEEIARAKAGIGRRELWERGMSIGRKVMCTMVLALVFAYLGANIPLLLLPRIVHDVPVTLLLNSDRFACEGLRILAGGIGVVVTIPATALLATFLLSRRKTA